MRLLLLLAAMALAVPAAAAPAGTAPPRLLQLIPNPAKITLRGPYATARLLVNGRLSNGQARDVSSQATFTVANPKIATVDENGTVEARRDGTTTVMARMRTGKTWLSSAIAVTV